jgi:hypothetical protein
VASKVQAWYGAGVEDFLRSMDPAHRAFLAIFFAVLIKSGLFIQWERFKERQDSLPITLKLRDGVHVPWGPVQRIQRFFQIALYIWLFYMALLVVGLIYMKAMGLERLF